MSYWGEYFEWLSKNIPGINSKVIHDNFIHRFTRLEYCAAIRHTDLSSDDMEKCLRTAADDAVTLLAYIILIAKQFGITEFQLEEYMYQKIGKTDDRVNKYVSDDHNIEKLYDDSFQQGYVGNSPEHGHYASWVNRIFNPTSILDVGCGPGYFSHHMKTFNNKIFIANVDLSDIGLLQGMPQNAVQGVSWKLPFRDNSFDLIIAGAIMEHIPLKHMSDTLNEFDRVANRKLLYIAMDPTRGEPISYGIEHITIASRKWWTEYIGNRPNYLIGAKEDPNMNDVGLDPDNKNRWSKINWSGIELNKYLGE